MYDVFISFSSKNMEYAEAVYDKLEQSGVKCWFSPKNIGTASVFSSEIIEGLNNSKIVVLIFSKYAQQSEYVNNEIMTAFRSGKRIVSLKVDETFPKDDMEFCLLTTQWLDVSPDTLKKEDRTLENSYDHFVEVIQKLLKNPNDENGFSGFNSFVKRKSFLERNKKSIIALILIVLVVVSGFIIVNSMNTQSSSDDTNETGITVGYVDLEDYGDGNYAYFVFGSVSDNLSNSSKDVVHIDYLDKSGDVVDTSDTKIGDVDGNTLGYIDTSDKDVVKVIVKLQDKNGKELYKTESSNILN